MSTSIASARVRSGPDLELPKGPDLRSAPCRDQDAELWFPLDERDPFQTVWPIAVCESVCTVRAECEQRAYEQGIDYGIWGGLTAAERRARRAKSIPASTSQEPPVTSVRVCMGCASTDTVVDVEGVDALDGQQFGLCAACAVAYGIRLDTAAVA